MAVGDLGCPIKIDEEVITGCWCTIGSGVETQFYHVRNCIYLMSWGDGAGGKATRATVKIDSAGCITPGALCFVERDACSGGGTKIEIFEINSCCNGTKSIWAAGTGASSVYGVQLETFSIDDCGLFTQVCCPVAIGCGAILAAFNGSMQYPGTQNFLLVWSDTTGGGGVHTHLWSSVISASGVIACCPIKYSLTNVTGSAGTPRLWRCGIGMGFTGIGIDCIILRTWCNPNCGCFVYANCCWIDNNTYCIANNTTNASAQSLRRLNACVPGQEDTCGNRMLIVGVTGVVSFSQTVWSVVTNDCGIMTPQCGCGLPNLSKGAGTPGQRSDILMIGCNKFVEYGRNGSVNVVCVCTACCVSSCYDSGCFAVCHSTTLCGINYSYVEGSCNSLIAVAFMDRIPCPDAPTIVTLAVESALKTPDEEITLLVELCIDQYNGFFGASGPIDVCFKLCIDEWREKVETGAIVYGLPTHESLAFSLNFVKFHIQLKGTLPPTVPHQSHPLTTAQAAAHFPDSTDLEEAALLFNGVGFSSTNKARLELPLPSGVRQYEGVIESIAIINNPGTDLQEFVLQFGVDWNPSFPILRAWNDE